MAALGGKCVHKSVHMCVAGGFKLGKLREEKCRDQLRCRGRFWKCSVLVILGDGSNGGWMCGMLLWKHSVLGGFGGKGQRQWSY